LLNKNFDLIIEISKMNLPTEKSNWILKQMISKLPILNQKVLKAILFFINKIINFNLKITVKFYFKLYYQLILYFLIIFNIIYILLIFNNLLYVKEKNFSIIFGPILIKNNINLKDTKDLTYVNNTIEILIKNLKDIFEVKLKI
jgi:hypothetical protein